MADFYISFGVQYAREPHPRFEWVHPDGYAVIEADDHDMARLAAFALIGREWSFLYDPEDFEPHWFPRGELHRFKAPAGKP